jgi:hypothetical protein
MTADDLTLRPLLARHPDARRAKAALLPPILLPYIALMFGSGIAALAAVYNALMMRRVGLAVRSLLVGAAGWFAFFLIITNADDHIRVLVIVGRVVHFLCGGLLYRMQRAHFAGSQFLHGAALPLVRSYVGAFVVYLFLPAKIVAFLLGVPLG